MKLKNVMFVCVFCCMITVAFSIPQIKTVYTVEAKTIKYGECGLDTDVCVAEWLKYDQSTPDGYLKYALTVNGLGDEIPLVEKLVKCESGGDIYAIGVNKGGSSVDRGYLQINNKYHKSVTNECAFDYKCNIDYAIKLRLEWGSWGAWSCLSKIN